MLQGQNRQCPNGLGHDTSTSKWDLRRMNCGRAQHELGRDWRRHTLLYDFGYIPVWYANLRRRFLVEKRVNHMVPSAIGHMLPHR